MNDTLTTRGTDEVLDILNSYRCQYTVDTVFENGMDLVDLLTPPGDKDITRGKQELELLADAIASALHDAKAARIAKLEAELSTAQQTLQALGVTLIR